MNSIIFTMLEKYACLTHSDYENALKEIIQEIALLGLYREKFFEHAAFYGGTALRILYGLDRFSEDLDFSLLSSHAHFDLKPYLKAIEVELTSMGFNAKVEEKKKNIDTSIESAFIKASTLEHFLKIHLPEPMARKVQKNAILTIKLEIDTHPPLGFETEAKVVLQPIPFSINTYKMPDLFAGKMHALLHRQWKGRVKGRDYYDFVWYIGRGTPVRLTHLEARLRQSGGWDSPEALSLKALKKLFSNKFADVDFELAKKDVLPFIRDPHSVQLWSKEFFTELLGRIQSI